MSAIAALFRTHNSEELTEATHLAGGDARVSDEAHEYRGAAIKGWIDGAIAKYKPHAEAADLAQVGDKTIVTAQVSGTFPGSPTQLCYNFTLKNGKIAALAIGT